MGRPIEFWCFVQGGRVTDGPFRLGNSYKDLHGLGGLTLEELQDRGLWPVQYACPSCTKDMTLEPDLDKRIVRAIPSGKTVEDLRGQIKLNGVAQYRFVLDNLVVPIFLTDEQKYGFKLDAITHSLCLEAILRRHIVKIPAFVGQNADRLVMVEVGPQDAEEIIAETSRARNINLERIADRVRRADLAKDAYELMEIMEEEFGTAV